MRSISLLLFPKPKKAKLVWLKKGNTFLCFQEKQRFFGSKISDDFLVMRFIRWDYISCGLFYSCYVCVNTRS